MALPNKSLAIASIIIGAYALIGLPMATWIAGVGALVIGILLLIK
jgi:hypothetical protein